MIDQLIELPAGASYPDSEPRGLTWTTDHPASSYGLGVLLLPDDGKALAGEILDGATFRCWRDIWGSRIETTDPVRVCQALGVPVDEPGVNRVG